MAAASTRNVMRWPITCGAASTEGAAGGPPGPPRGPLDLQGPAGAARDQQDPLPHPSVTFPIPAAGSNKVPLWGIAVGREFHGSGCSGGNLDAWPGPWGAALPSTQGGGGRPGYPGPRVLCRAPGGQSPRWGGGDASALAPRCSPPPPANSGGKIGVQRLYWRDGLKVEAALAAGEKSAGGPGSSWGGGGTEQGG